MIQQSRRADRCLDSLKSPSELAVEPVADRHEPRERHRHQLQPNPSLLCYDGRRRIDGTTRTPSATSAPNARLHGVVLGVWQLPQRVVEGRIDGFRATVTVVASDALVVHQEWPTEAMAFRAPVLRDLVVNGTVFRHRGVAARALCRLAPVRGVVVAGFALGRIRVALWMATMSAPWHLVHSELAEVTA